MMARRKVLLPSLAVITAGAVWGAFWLPLRALETAGLDGAWATLPPVAVGVLVLAPIALARRRGLAAGGWPVALAGVFGGTGYALYSDAFLLTEVVTAILLFYLTPVWSTLLSRVLLGQPITRSRMVTIALGFAGLWVILGIDGGLPLPRGPGDWFGLVAGMIWAGASVGFRKHNALGAAEMGFLYLCGTLIAAAAIPLVSMPLDAGTFGRLAAATIAAWPLVVFMGVVMFAGSMVLAIWGNQRMDPGRVGILMMSEVLVATATAAALTDEPFGWRQITGGVLVIAAAVIDIAARAPEPALPKPAA